MHAQDADVTARQAMHHAVIVAEQRSSALCRPSSAIARAVASSRFRRLHCCMSCLKHSEFMLLFFTPPVYGLQDSRIERVPATGSALIQSKPLQDSHEI